jgi:hypothetical protein
VPELQMLGPLWSKPTHRVELDLVPFKKTLHLVDAGNLPCNELSHAIWQRAMKSAKHRALEW